MISSFKCKYTALLWTTGNCKKLPSDIHRVALRKLLQLDNAEALKDLSAPPNNRLEALKGNRLGEYSIRINNQWRVCFKWENQHATNVEIIDYH